MVVSTRRIVIKVKVVVRTKPAIFRQLELGPVQPASTRPGAPAVPNLSSVKDFFLVRDERRIEIAIRMPRIFELEFRRIPVRDRRNVVRRNDEPRRSQVSCDSPVV